MSSFRNTKSQKRRVHTLIEALEPRRLLSLPPPADPTPYQRVVIDQNPGGQPLEKTLLDVNGDTKLDAVIGHRDNTGIYWYAYPSSGVVTDTWSKYTIVNTGNCYETSAAADVNGDNAVDLICSYNDQMVWFENPRGHGADPRTATWTMHLIGNTQGHDMVMADFDGDGKFDIATNKTIYFQNSPTSWTAVSASNYSRTGDGVALLDTGHGKIDLVGTGPAAAPHTIKWYENPRDHGGNARTDVWTMRTIGSVFDPNDARGGLCYESADINKDGHMDIVTAQNEQADDFAPPPPVGVSWYESPADPRTGTWIHHQIDVGITNVHDVRLADANGDGRVEIYYAEQEQSANDRVGILYNMNGDGLTWTNQVLYTGSGHNIFVADVDGDGDPDMLNSAHGVYGHADPIELYVDQRSNNKPQITTQPQSQTILSGSPVTFSASASGAAPLSYRWQRNNVDINGATAASYTINSTALGDSGAKFHVVVTNSLGFTISNDATLTVASALTTTYLSSLTPTFTSNGWGPYEKDKSNGEQAAGDGKTITINGATFAKGLGVHASSELRYSLAKQYSRYQAKVGVDDETGGAGSVDFQVFGDGILLLDSGVMRGHQAAQSIDLDVTNVTELKLIVTDGGDGNNSDHADWADAKVLKYTFAQVLAVSPLLSPTINEGGAYSATGSFSDTGAGPWTATVNYGDGSGTGALPLNPDKTFALSHSYADNGNYTVTVVVNNATTNAQNTGAVTVKNVVPIVSIGSNGSSGVNFSRAGSFSDPGTLDTFTASVDYGDGTGAQALALNPDKSFALSHSYAFNGTYAVKVTVTDKDGGVGSASVNMTITGGQTQGVAYLSDLTATSITGPFALDKSNGGNVLKLKGVQYAKGIGVSAASDVRYNLAGQYKTFTATVGLDDEVGSTGTVVFQVYLDGKKVYDSKKMKGGANPKSLNINVTGKSELRLVVTDGGDGATNDHADWADAKINTLTVPATAPTSESIQ